MPPGRVLWDRLGRSLLPTYGARANAADGLADLQRTRLARADAQAALARSGDEPTLASEVVGRPQR